VPGAVAFEAGLLGVMMELAWRDIGELGIRSVGEGTVTVLCEIDESGCGKDMEGGEGMARGNCGFGKGVCGEDNEAARWIGENETELGVSGGEVGEAETPSISIACPGDPPACCVPVFGVLSSLAGGVFVVVVVDGADIGDESGIVASAGI